MISNSKFWLIKIIQLIITIGYAAYRMLVMHDSFRDATMHDAFFIAGFTIIVYTALSKIVRPAGSLHENGPKETK